jgi:hypothetical protein
MPASRISHHPKQFAKNSDFVGYFPAFQISLWLFVTCLSIASVAQAVETRDSVMNRLANVEVFAFGGVGFAGITSPGEKDYRLILADPAAETAFEKLFAIGNPQAKCYALAGLRQLNPEKFKALSASLRSSKIEVSTMRGCIMRHERMTAVLADIQAGNYSK